MSHTATFPSDKGLKKPVCVFCGSSPGSSPIYAQAAKAVGEALAAEGIPLVYGGGRRGLMGTVSKAALVKGGYVHGIVPKALVERATENTSISPTGAGSPSGPVPGDVLKSKEGQGTDLLEDDVDGRLSVEVVDSMHVRKWKMAQLSQGGFVVLPGGYGTFEEMMEVITWNQLGIHRLPVVVLNVGGIYEPLKALLKNSVEAGFIRPDNLSLVQILDIPPSASIEEWGPVTIKALREWTFESGIGYGLNWEVEKEVKATESQAIPTQVKRDEQFSLFTTLRFTSPDVREATLPVEATHVPLVRRHVARLKAAHEYFRRRDGGAIWGEWIGDEVLLHSLLTELEGKEREKQGDWRVRVLIHRGGKLEVQILPAPAEAGPFQFLSSPQVPFTRRPLILDPQSSVIATEDESETVTRLYKTTRRAIYDEAAKRGGALHPNIPHPEVLLHTGTHILESTTSNIALYCPIGPGLPEWITPKLDIGRWPFLDGVTRRYLLDEGVIREGEVTVEEYGRHVKEGGRVIGFNGLRGVWEAGPR